MIILEYLGIHPVSFSKASHLLRFELPSGCTLFMPFDKVVESTIAKQKLIDYFNASTSDDKEETGYEIRP